ncbi:monothiol glutaredoxin-S3-like [Phoenix dactylifera]|uniref:Monothiol glutaredoxin-S3-like n=1 Tax=Phoenix dactylifera TaxID=42345 RepID=A0A8B7BQA6_PHODC|nr:monothiol glutaredoxin-S3-like [Phoenix dactylifera]
MQQAIPYSNGRAWAPRRNGGGAVIGGRTAVEQVVVAARCATSGGEIRRVVEENPVVVVGRRGCCMVHVVRRLLLGQGVNPTVCEVGEDADEAALIAELPPSMAASGAAGSGGDVVGHLRRQGMVLPAVFIGGRLVGGLDRLMAVHISGELVPILKQAGALWL